MPWRTGCDARGERRSLWIEYAKLNGGIMALRELAEETSRRVSADITQANDLLETIQKEIEENQRKDRP